MKLTLDELKVDSYANEVSETEIDSVKGGVTTTHPCGAVILAWLLDQIGDDDGGDPPPPPPPPTPPAN